MKKKVIALSIALVLSAAGSGSAQSRFGFKLGEGISYLNGGDLNAGAQGMSDFYADLFSLDGAATTRGGYRPLHLGVNFSAELFYQVSPKIAVGLGMGYFEAVKKSELILNDYVGEVKVRWEPRIAVVPLTLNFRYLIPVGSGFKLSLTAGAGLYLARCQFEWAFQNDLTQMDLTAAGFGAHGGIGLEIELTPSFSLTFDVLGRYAQAGPLTGEYLTEDQSVSGGTLWNVEVFYFRLGTYPSLFYSSADISNSPGAQKTRLDLNGFGAAVGILIRL